MEGTTQATVAKGAKKMMGDSLTAGAEANLLGDFTGKTTNHTTKAQEALEINKYMHIYVH